MQVNKLMAVTLVVPVTVGLVANDNEADKSNISNFNNTTIVNDYYYNQIKESKDEFNYLKRDFNSFDFDINSIKCENATELLDIPSYVENNNSVVHPSVISFDSPWNGYKYWMGITPYPESNNKFENPSIVVSNDGINWEELEGVTNPIAPAPAQGYNSDINIFMDPTNTTMYCMWRELRWLDGAERCTLKIMSSTDGVNWSEPTEALRTLDKDNASPCVIYDEGKYKLFSVNVLDGSRTTSIQMYESDNPLGGWVYVKDIEIPNIAEDKQLWHFEIKKIEDTYVILYQVATWGYYGGDGRLYLGKSKDLSNWEITKKPIIYPEWEGDFYKSSFSLGEYNGEPCFDLWYGTRYINSAGVPAEWGVAFTKVMFDKTIEDDSEIEINKKIIINDNFDRQDSENDIGQTPEGFKWENIKGDLGILGEMVYNSNGKNAISVVDISDKNVDISVKYSTVASDQWIVFRVQDGYNFLRAGYIAGKLIIQKVEDGIATNIFTKSEFLSNGDELKVSINDSNIKVYLNNSLVGEVIEEAYMNYTKVGIQTCSLTARFDDFIVSKDIEEDKGEVPEPEQPGNPELGIEKIMVSDDFNRIDSEFEIGKTTQGFIWNNIGYELGILNGEVYNNNGKNGIAVLDVKESDINISVNYSVASSDQWIVFRVKDIYNFLRVGKVGGNIYIQRVQNGLATTILSESKLLNNNDELKVSTSGENIKIYVNGVLIGQVNETAYIEETKVGLQTCSLDARFDNFKVTKVISEGSESTPDPEEPENPTPGPGESEKPTPEPEEPEIPRPDPEQPENPTPDPGESEKPNPEPENPEDPTPDPEPEEPEDPTPDFSIPKVIINDNFNREDSELSIGNTDEGYAWENIGYELGILNGEVYNSNGNNGMAIVNVNKSDIDVSVNYSTASNDQWILFRVKDAYNFLRVGKIGGNIYIQRVQSGQAITILSQSKLLNNNDELKVSASGENIKIYVNEVLIGEVNETAYIEETKVGLQTCSLDARFDNFKVTFKE